MRPVRILLCVLVAAASVRGDVAIPRSEVPETIRRIAELRVQAMSGFSAVPVWKEASLGEEVLPLYRPDVEGIAYYEIPVRPSGVITVSTGSHDFPVVFWSDRAVGEGTALLQRAGAAGQKVHRIYRLGPIDYVAENEQGELLPVSRQSAGATQELTPNAPAPARMERSTFVYEPAQRAERNGAAAPEKIQRTGPQKSPFTLRTGQSWAQVKARYGEVRQPALAALKREAEAAWAARKALPVASALPSPTPGRTYFEVDAPGDAPHYRQIDAGTPPNTTGCASGCGATAWAIVAGWFDRRAAATGSTSGNGRIFMNGAADVPADMSMTPLAQSFIWSIRDTLGSDCSPGVPAGWTLPYKMERITDWMKARTIGLAVAAHYSSWFVTYDDIRVHAVNQIRARRPAVIGIGAGASLHYPVAIAYRELPIPGGNPIEREFFVNMGWGGSSDGWIPASIWFSGTLATAMVPNTGQHCKGLEGQDYLCCMKPYLPVCG